jgi:hypothetical protein
MLGWMDIREPAVPNPPFPIGEALLASIVANVRKRLIS